MRCLLSRVIVLLAMLLHCAVGRCPERHCDCRNAGAGHNPTILHEHDQESVDFAVDACADPNRHCQHGSPWPQCSHAVFVSKLSQNGTLSTWTISSVPTALLASKCAMLRKLCVSGRTTGVWNLHPPISLQVENCVFLL